MYGWPCMLDKNGEKESFLDTVWIRCWRDRLAYSDSMYLCSNLHVNSGRSSYRHKERITVLAAEKSKIYKLHTADFILLGMCGRC